MSKTRGSIVLTLILGLATLSTISALESYPSIPGVRITTPLDARFVPTAPLDLSAKAAVILDAETGAVLFEKDPYVLIPPASLTKLMTMHLALQAVQRGEASLDEVIPLPPQSWATNAPWGSSLMFLAKGQTVTLRELLLGLAVDSGNDAAIAVALRLGGSVSGFVEQMNDEARRMGLNKTHFVDPSGYSELNQTCAGDYATLCRIYLRLHPEATRDYHSVKEFSYPAKENVGPAFKSNPGTVLQRNRNLLLGRVQGVDGLKTGYIPESGYNLAISAQREGTSIVAVVLGGPGSSSAEGAKSRAEDGRRVVDWAFQQYRTLRPPIELPEALRIWKAANKLAPIVLGQGRDFTVPAGRGRGLSIRVELNHSFEAPAVAGTPVGQVVIGDEAGELRTIPIVLAKDAERGSFFVRLWDSIRLFFHRHFNQG